MVRRGICATLLVIAAVQMLGGMALASPCSDPCSDLCPEDGPGSGCPPICALCTSCPHAQTAIVQRAVVAEPLRATHEMAQQQRFTVSSPLTADIFHVPLLG